MENEKKLYETPVVTKVEYDVRDQITASGCDLDGGFCEQYTVKDVW